MLNKEDKEVQVVDAWTCAELTAEAIDAGDIEPIHVDFATNVATVRRGGHVTRGPMMMSKEVAVLFV